MRLGNTMNCWRLREPDRLARSATGRDQPGGDGRLQFGDGAMATATTETTRLAIKVLKATSGVFSLIDKARNLPAVVASEVDLSGFPRLKKITATGAIATARLRGLAARVGDRFPDDLDLFEEASVDWV